MYFEIIDEVRDIEQINADKNESEKERIKKKYEAVNWRKLKGKVQVRLGNGSIVKAEVHWYEMPVAVRKDIKIKNIYR